MESLSTEGYNNRENDRDYCTPYCIDNADEIRLKNQAAFEQVDQDVKNKLQKIVGKYYPAAIHECEILEAFQEFANKVLECCKPFCPGPDSTSDGLITLEEDLRTHFHFLLDQPIKTWRRYFDMIEDNYATSIIQDDDFLIKKDEISREALMAMGILAMAKLDNNQDVGTLSDDEDFQKLVALYNKHVERPEKIDPSAKPLIPDEPIPF